MKYLGALVAVLFAVVGSAHATEFLQNGSFETGDFTGWTLENGAGLLTSVQQTPFAYGAESGKFYVYAGPPSSLPGILTQRFSDTAGAKLNISGWAIGDIAIDDGLGEVSYFFDGVHLGSPDLSSGNWTQSIFPVIATGLDAFSVQFANDNSFNGLDNFSVTSAGAVPEPSTWILLLVGLIGLRPVATTARRALFLRAS
jgi:hypothetical protein